MLKIYNYEPDNIGNYDLVYSEDIAKSLKHNKLDPLWQVLCRVENVSQASEGKVYSKFNTEPVSVYDISKGVQILLCILKYPNTVFSTLECGDNIFNEIYSLSEGSVYMPSGIMPYYDDKDIVVMSKKGSKICHNCKEATDYYEQTI